MTKINIHLNNKTYTVDEFALSPAVMVIKDHLATIIDDDGIAVSFDGTVYNVDSTKLATTASEIVSHLSELSGSDLKVIVSGVEYTIDSSKIHKALAELEEALSKLNNSDMVVIVLDEAILDYSILG